jgi:4-hydroxybenzoate polyprenyltransferase
MLQYARLMRLDRPIGIWLLLWPTLWALWIASSGHPRPRVFAAMALGVIVMRSAGCVINDYADRKLDAKVARTRDRPLASGRVTPTEALVLFFALGLLAIALVVTLNRLTQQLAAVGALLTVAYPFAKRVISAPQLVLGAAFGWSAPMAFAAETGAVPRMAWMIWLAVIVWALIYDTEYAMTDRADDLAAGVKSTAILFGSADVFIVGLLMFVMLIALVLIGQQGGFGPWYYGSVGVTAVLFLWQHWLIRERQPADCFRAFMGNAHVGGAVFAGILLDYLFRAS